MTERKLSPLVGKAETKLINHDKQTQYLVDSLLERRDQKRAAIIAGFDEDVRNALRAMHIIEEEGVDDGA